MPPPDPEPFAVAGKLYEWRTVGGRLRAVPALHRRSPSAGTHRLGKGARFTFEPAAGEPVDLTPYLVPAEPTTRRLFELAALETRAETRAMLEHVENEVAKLAASFNLHVDAELRKVLDELVSATGCTYDEAVGTVRRVFEQAGSSPYDADVTYRDGRVFLTSHVPLPDSSPRPPRIVE